jgi:hypothetical protein
LQGPGHLTDRGALRGFHPSGAGTPFYMELSLLLIIIGIVLAVFVHYALGIVLILIGLVLLIWPRITAARGRV